MGLISCLSSTSNINMSMYTRNAKLNKLVPTPQINPDNKFFTQGLSYYNSLNQGLFASSVMIFIGVGIGPEEIKENVQFVSSRIRAITSTGLKPLIVVEPNSLSQGKLSFNSIAQGKYNKDFTEFFTALQRTGITDSQMGLWCVWPEPNLPNGYWNKEGFIEENFGDMYNNYTSQLKKYFPQTQITILMDAKTYTNTDYNTANGRAISWKPYLTKIDKDTVHSIGMQGFTWYSKDSNDQLADPKDYLPINILIEAAKIIGVSTVWINTGQAYQSQGTSLTTIPTSQRNRINQELAAQILRLRQTGLNVELNLFLENKIQTPEGVNWSYGNSSQESQLFSNFISTMQYMEVPIGVKL
jgi:hypothetical protein